MITFSDEIPALAPRYPTQQSRFAVWVHDEPGTMENIDSAIEILKNGLPGYALSAGGIYVAECWWETTSNDAYDDHYQTNTRYAEFLTTYRSN